MKVQRSGTQLTVVLDAGEVELMRLALRRATFEDTPPGSQRAILEFADTLLRALGDSER